MKKDFITSGFTLIELMVATSIFIVIMLMAMSALVTSSDSARKSQALRDAMDNVNFAMENMSRTLRISSNYSCVASGGFVDLSLVPTPADCPLGGGSYGSLVEFVPPASLAIAPGSMAYQSVLRADGTRTLQRCTTISCIDIVSPSVDVQLLKFYVNGSDPTDTTQPSVYMIMRGVVNVKGVATSFTMQTLASQRSSE